MKTKAGGYYDHVHLLQRAITSKDGPKCQGSSMQTAWGTGHVSMYCFSFRHAQWLWD